MTLEEREELYDFIDLLLPHLDREGKYLAYKYVDKLEEDEDEQV